MFFKPELQIQKMNHVCIQIKMWRAKQDIKMYFVKKGRKILQCLIRLGQKENR